MTQDDRAIQELFQIDDAGFVFIAPAITDWATLTRRAIDVVVDLEGALDIGVPTTPGQCLYVYFPIADAQLPDLAKLRAVAELGAALVRAGHRVLAHCGLGFNRSALVGGLILHLLGMPGPLAVARIQQRRPGALYNEHFATYLLSLHA